MFFRHKILVVTVIQYRFSQTKIVFSADERSPIRHSQRNRSCYKRIRPSTNPGPIYLINPRCPRINQAQTTRNEQPTRTKKKINFRILKHETVRGFHRLAVEFIGGSKHNWTFVQKTNNQTRLSNSLWFERVSFIYLTRCPDCRAFGRSQTSFVRILTWNLIMKKCQITLWTTLKSPEYFL